MEEDVLEEWLVLSVQYRRFDVELRRGIGMPGEYGVAYAEEDA